VFLVNCPETPKKHSDHSHKSQVDTGIYLIPDVWLFELAVVVAVNL